MWLLKTKPAPVLTEELIQRVWDCSSRLKQLEDRLDAKLDDLSVRYRRAEQSQARLERKQAASPCDDAEADQDGSLAHRAFAYGSGVPKTPANGVQRVPE